MPRSFAFVKSDASEFQAPYRVDYGFWLIQEKDAVSGLYTVNLDIQKGLYRAKILLGSVKL